MGFILKKLKNFITYKKYILAACTLSLSLTIPYISYATTQDNLDDANQKLEELRQQQADISSDMSDLVSQIDDINRSLTEIDEKMQDLSDKIDDLSMQKEELDKQKTEQYAAMKLRIQYMYEHGSQNALDIILSSQGLSDFLSKSEYVTQLSSYDRRMLEKMENIITQIAENSDELEKDYASLDKLKSESSRQSERLNALLDSKQQELASNSDDITKFEELALQYEQQLEEDRIREAEEAARREQEKNNSTSDTNNGSNNTGGISNPGGNNYPPIDYTASDIDMLAAIIECEAGNQSYEGKCAVGSVIINRVRNPRFANTIQEVIFAPGQFSPVASGRFAIVLARGADSACIEAATAVLNGYINVDSLYFHAYRGSIDDDKLIIGDHVFF